MYSNTELFNLKSAGTYRFEIDKSVVTTGSDPLSNVRLFVGFSRVGQFNTPVFVRDTKEFTEKFGGIDRTLEMRGSFFHRSCLAALELGPIYCLNLLNLRDEDKVNVMDFSVSATGTAQTKDPAANTYKYRGMYNIDTFYTPSEESFLNNIGRKHRFVEYDGTPGSESTNNLLSFTNIGKSPVSIVVTKSSDYNTMNYQVTCQEWFGKGNVPEYLDENSFISDYMVDVYVISGDWGGDFASANAAEGPYKRFSSDVKFAKYFNEHMGLVRRKKFDDTTDTMFTMFLNEPDVNLLGKYTGSVIPGFVDKNGNNQYIEYLVNKDTMVNGVMCAVNEEVFTGEVKIDGNRQGIDMIGHNIYRVASEEGLDSLNFLSYRGVVGGEIKTPLTWASTFAKVNNDTYYNVSSPSGQATAFTAADEDTEVKIVDFRTAGTRGTIDIYAYFFDEGAAPASGTYTDQMKSICEDFSANGRAFVKIAGKLFPVSAVSVTELTSLIDYTDGGVEPKKGDGTSGGVIINSQIAAAFTGDYDFQATPITKVKVTVSYNLNPGFTASSDIQGFYTSAVVRQLAVFDNGFGTAFLEGTEVFEQSGSLNTNDRIILGGSLAVYDINWIKPVDSQRIKQIDGCAIMDDGKYLSYIVGKYYDVDGNPARPVLSDFRHADGSDTDLSGLYNLVLRTGSLEMTVNVEDVAEWGLDIRENQFVIPVSHDEQYKKVVVGNYVLAKGGGRLSRIIKINGIEYGDDRYRLVTCQEAVAVDSTVGDSGEVRSVEVFTKLSDWFRNYDVFTLSGFALEAYHMPDGSEKKQHDILDILDAENKSTNLFNALIDREIIQFRYVVDTFGLGIEEMCKAQYTNLCMNRKSAFAIVNAPSCKDFQNSADPSFVDANNSVSAEFIAKGGDPDKNPSFLFTLPDKVNGASWGAYYYPYLKVYSNYTTILVPPAAYVSNKYIEKYATGKPWETVAGERRGVIKGFGVVGVESTLIRDSRDWLEPMGINAIIYRNGIGCEIYANRTAQQTPRSALSSINAREACIFIQDGVERILENYLFENNNAQTRLEIKTLVDNFLEDVKSKHGIYNFHTVMNTSNNTPEIIDRNMGVIDIYIEPEKAMDILVQRLTILKTGAIESGNFM